MAEQTDANEQLCEPVVLERTLVIHDSPEPDEISDSDIVLSCLDELLISQGQLCFGVGEEEGISPTFTMMAPGLGVIAGESVEAVVTEAHFLLFPEAYEADMESEEESAWESATGEQQGEYWQISLGVSGEQDQQEQQQTREQQTQQQQQERPQQVQTQQQRSQTQARKREPSKTQQQPEKQKDPQSQKQEQTPERPRSARRGQREQPQAEAQAQTAEKPAREQKADNTKSSQKRPAKPAKAKAA